jgi:hypothetical protein
MKKIIFVIGAIAALGLQACTTVPVAKIDSPEAKLAASFTPESDKAVVYLYRAADSDYKVYEIPVEFSDAGNATTAAIGYTRVEVEPGTYELDASTYEATSSIEPIKLDLNAGDVVFVELSLQARFALGATGGFRVVDAKNAKKEIQNRHLVPLTPKRL